MIVFYFFAAIVICLGILSLRGGFRFAAYVRREVSRPLSDFTPFATVIAPCRGLEDGLQDNLAALFAQEYPAFEIILVTGQAKDPSVGVIEKLIGANPDSVKVSARVLIAGEAVDCGQKVHNLRVALSQIDPRSEALVFVDSDARPFSNWLRSLVGPLQDESLGAATGYRWFISHRGLASHLRSVWNASIASALGGAADKNFCWGGSTAIEEPLRTSRRGRALAGYSVRRFRVDSSVAGGAVADTFCAGVPGAFVW